jgi:site-specific recombinase XerD
MDRNRRLGELWLDALISERGPADGTIEAYQDDLDGYLRFLADRALDLADVSRASHASYPMSVEAPMPPPLAQMEISSSRWPLVSLLRRKPTMVKIQATVPARSAKSMP